MARQADEALKAMADLALDGIEPEGRQELSRTLMAAARRLAE